jgi:Common central domain of tyrosinase/Polyphenol oxidase middle domain
MNWSRRQLLRLAGLLPALGTAGPPCGNSGSSIVWKWDEVEEVVPNEPLCKCRVSSTSFLTETHKPDRDRMAAAYQKLIKGTPSLMDLQGQLHAAYCTNATNDKPPGMPGDVHDSAYFLLWHRGFVYFHEKMLQKYAPPDTIVSLPYWDWSSDSMVKLYPPSARPVCLKSPTSKGFSPGLAEIVNQAAITAISILRYADFRSALERSHDSGHQLPGGLMPDLAVAAWDPLFYGHHANCDRYFASWQDAHKPPKKIQLKTQTNRYLPVPEIDLDLDQTMLYFYNEDGHLVKVKALNLWDTKTLGYEYDKLETPTATHRFLSSGTQLTSQGTLGEAIRRALKNDNAVWAELSDPDDSPTGVGERIAFLLSSENEVLPKNAGEMSNDPRVLGQISRLPHAHHPKAQRSSSTVDATAALNHFVKSGAKKMWIATVEIDRSGNLQNRKAWPKKAKLRTAYFSVNRRTPR